MICLCEMKTVDSKYDIYHDAFLTSMETSAWYAHHRRKLGHCLAKTGASRLSDLGGTPLPVQGLTPYACTAKMQKMVAQHCNTVAKSFEQAR